MRSLFPLWRASARRVNSLASRLPGTTRFRFALHGAQRGQLAGRIEQCRRELERLVADVGHLDGSIKLFAPDYKLEGIRAKVPRQRNQFFRQGECQRLVLEIFRDAENPCPHAKWPRPW